MKEKSSTLSYNPDFPRWTENAAVLTGQIQGVLCSLESIKRTLMEPDSNLKNFMTSAEYFTPNFKPASRLSFTYNNIESSPIEYPSRPERPQFSSLSHTLFIPIFKLLNKKPYELQDIKKAPGYNDFLMGNAAIIADLEPCYITLYTSVFLLQSSASVIRQTRSFGDVEFEKDCGIANMFLELSANFVALAFMLEELGKAKIGIASYYAHAYQAATDTEEPNFSGLCKFLKDFSSPLEYVQPVFNQVSEILSSLLMSMKDEILFNIGMKADGLQSSSILSLTPDFSGVKSTKISDMQLYNLTTMRSRFRMFFLLSLTIPDEIAENNGFEDLVKGMLNYGSIIPVIRSQGMHLVDTFDKLAKANGKVKKIRDVIHDGIPESLRSAKELHQGRRHYLRQQMRQVFNLIDCTELLCSKFLVVVAACGITRDEISWYFDHFNADDFYGKRNRKLGAESDAEVIELIFFLKRVMDILMANQKDLREGLLEDLTSKRFPAFLKLIEDALHMSEESESDRDLLLHAVVKSFDKFDSKSDEELVAKNEYKTLYLELMRLQMSLTYPSKAEDIRNHEDVAKHQSYHGYDENGRWMYDFEGCIQETFSLQDLFFHQDTLHKLLNKAIMDVSPSVRYFGAFGYVATDFTNMLSRYWPVEDKFIGATATCFASECFLVIGEFAARVALNTLNEMNILDQQLLPEEAVFFLPVDEATKAKKSRRGKVDALEQQPPGFESAMENLDSIPLIKRLMSKKALFENVVMGLGQPSQFIIYNQVMEPQLYFRDNFVLKATILLNVGCLRGFPNSPLAETPTNILRPSHFLELRNSYISGAQYVDSLIPGCRMLDSIRQAINDQLLPAKAQEILAKIDKVEGSPTKTTRGPVVVNDHPFIVSYLMWYKNFLETHAEEELSPTSGVVYSSAQRTFLRLDATKMTEPYELRALVQILGPDGISFLDQKLVQYISTKTQALISKIEKMSDSLARVPECLEDEVTIEDFIRKEKDFPKMCQITIGIGFVVEFRKALFQAVRETLEDVHPFILNSVKTVHEQYPPNLSSSAHLIGFDFLANKLGFTDRVDVMLSNAIAVVARPDNVHLQHIPSLFTLFMFNAAYDERFVWNNSIQGMENNGHCLASAFITLTTAIFGQRGKGEIGIKRAHFQFFDQTSKLLLTLRRLPQDKHFPPRIHEPYLILRSIGLMSNYLPCSVIDKCMPPRVLQKSLAASVEAAYEGVNVADDRPDEDEMEPEDVVVKKSVERF